MTWFAVGVIGSAVVGGVASNLSSRSANKGNAALGRTGQSIFDSGTALTSEGLGDLRNSNSTYQSLLKNPLGTGPNSASGIFARARGANTDIATREQGAFGARLFQQARQSGGSLSPEAQAELEAQNARDTNQSLFDSNNKISDSEASLTLSETSKLFDRMDSISRTILGVGMDQRTQGLQAIMSSISAKYAAAAATMASANNAANTAINGYKTYQAANPPAAHP